MFCALNASCRWCIHIMKTASLDNAIHQEFSLVSEPFHQALKNMVRTRSYLYFNFLYFGDILNKTITLPRSLDMRWL